MSFYTAAFNLKISLDAVTTSDIIFSIGFPQAPVARLHFAFIKALIPFSIFRTLKAFSINIETSM